MIALIEQYGGWIGPGSAGYARQTAIARKMLAGEIDPHLEPNDFSGRTVAEQLSWGGASALSVEIVRMALERQIQRMLADDRAQALVWRFFFPWFELDKLGNSDPDKRYFPDYDVSLRDSLARETELFLLSQVRDDRHPVELWSANYTFLNEQLAKHYDIPNVSGPQFRRVSLSTSDGSRPERAGFSATGAS